MAGTMPFYCSCDELCEAYRDCCWDYRTRCGRRHVDQARRWQPLLGAQVVCHHGHALISTCNDVDEPTDHKNWNQDYREHVVSDDVVGLHFRNRHIYGCNENLLGLKSFKKWTKVIEDVDFGTLRAELHDFIHFGNASDVLSQHLRDEPPVSVRTRACYAFSRTSCNLEEYCKRPFPDLMLFNATWLCEHVTTLLSLRDILTSTTSPTFPSTIPWSTNPSTAPYDTCMTSVSQHQSFNVSSDHSLSVEFNDDLTVARVDVTRIGANWTRVQCLEYMFEMPNVSCQFRLVCAKHDIFIYPECYTPYLFRVSSESARAAEALAISERIVEEVETANYDPHARGLKLKDKTSYQTRAGGVGLNQTFDLSENLYVLSNIKGSGIDIQQHLMTVFRESKKSVDIRFGDNATICFYVSKLKFSACQAILVNGVVASPYHQREVSNAKVVPIQTETSGCPSAIHRILKSVPLGTRFTVGSR